MFSLLLPSGLGPDGLDDPLIAQSRQQLMQLQPDSPGLLELAAEHGWKSEADMAALTEAVQTLYQASLGMRAALEQILGLVDAAGQAVYPADSPTPTPQSRLTLMLQQAGWWPVVAALAASHRPSEVAVPAA